MVYKQIAIPEEFCSQTSIVVYEKTGIIYDQRNQPLGELTVHFDEESKIIYAGVSPNLFSLGLLPFPSPNPLKLKKCITGCWDRPTNSGTSLCVWNCLASAIFERIKQPSNQDNPIFHKNNFTELLIPSSMKSNNRFIKYEEIIQVAGGGQVHVQLDFGFKYIKIAISNDLIINKRIPRTVLIENERKYLDCSRSCEHKPSDFGVMGCQLGCMWDAISSYF